MESEKLLESLFDKKILNILRLLVKKRDQKFTLQEIAKSTKVPLASCFRILRKLLELEIISMEKTKHLKIYFLNENDKTKYLKNVLK
jgi:DNA-binding IclR family transcriptional regulator